jgi:hypothetical protein
MARLAAVLSSYLFFLVSCTGTAFLAQEPLRQLGGQHMANGRTPDSRVIVLASLPNPDKPGTHQVRQFMLGQLDGFKKANPQHSFLLPPGEGRVEDAAAAFSTTYKVKPLAPGRVEIETDAFHDALFGLSLFARYEATERDIKPIFTSASSPTVGLVAGVFVALVLAIIGAVMKIILRRRAATAIAAPDHGNALD